MVSSLFIALLFLTALAPFGCAIAARQTTGPLSVFLWVLWALCAAAGIAVWYHAYVALHLFAGSYGWAWWVMALVINMIALGDD
jgi:hypothetical protein